MSGYPMPPDDDHHVCAAIRRYLAAAERLAMELLDDPDEVTIERALRTLEAIRDGLRLKDDVRDRRDDLVAGLSLSAPELTMQTIAMAAGVGDSYAARVAARRGAARRPRNPVPVPRDASA